jgi:hypothetical protein
MSERRFVLVDFTYMNRTAYLRLYEAGHIYALSRAVAHAATKRALVDYQHRDVLGVALCAGDEALVRRPLLP